MGGTIGTSENRATAATLVDRNGGVLDEELVAFRAPDEPQAVRFHGHRFPSLACVRAWEARMQALDYWSQMAPILPSPADADTGKQNHISVPFAL